MSGISVENRPKSDPAFEPFFGLYICFPVYLEDRKTQDHLDLVKPLEETKQRDLISLPVNSDPYLN